MTFSIFAFEMCNPGQGASTDSLGQFRIEHVAPGIHQLSVSCIGYKNLLSPEYIVSAKLPPVELELEEDASQLAEVTVQAAAPFRRIKESPVSLQIIGLSEIEKSPGGSPYTPYDEDKSSLVEAWDVQGRPYYDYSRYNTCRLDAFAQLDVRVDKNYYFRGWRLGVYLDLQNVTKSVLRQQDVLMSTGVVENPEAPAAEQRYVMKRLKQESGTLLPTIGLTVEF